MVDWEDTLVTPSIPWWPHPGDSIDKVDILMMGIADDTITVTSSVPSITIMTLLIPDWSDFKDILLWTLVPDNLQKGTLLEYISGQLKLDGPY